MPRRLPVPWGVWGYVMRDLKAPVGPGPGRFSTCYRGVSPSYLAHNGPKKNVARSRSGEGEEEQDRGAAGLAAGSPAPPLPPVLAGSVLGAAGQEEEEQDRCESACDENERSDEFDLSLFLINDSLCVPSAA